MSVEISFFKSNQLINLKEEDNLSKLTNKKEDLYICSFKQFYYFTKSYAKKTYDFCDIHLIDVNCMVKKLQENNVIDNNFIINKKNLDETSIDFDLDSSLFQFNNIQFLKFQSFIKLLAEAYRGKIKYIYVEYDM